MREIVTKGSLIQSNAAHIYGAPLVLLQKIFFIWWPPDNMWWPPYSDVVATTYYLVATR